MIANCSFDMLHTQGVLTNSVQVAGMQHLHVVAMSACNKPSFCCTCGSVPGPEVAQDLWECVRASARWAALGSARLLASCVMGL